MQPRRSRPVLPHILPPATDSGDLINHNAASVSPVFVGPPWDGGIAHGLENTSTTPRSTRKAGKGIGGDADPRLSTSSAQKHHRQQQQQQQPQRAASAAMESAAPAYSSPNSKGAAPGVTPFPTRVSVSDGKGLGMSEVTLMKKQSTNTRAVIDVALLNYSEAMRGYRVYKHNRSAHPWLRLFSTNDMILLAMAVSFFLSCLVSLDRSTTTISDPPAAKVQRHRWFNAVTSPTNHEVARIRAQLEESFFFKVRLVVFVLCTLLAVLRFVFALRKVFVEEVIAIRGVGLQLTDYDVFGRIKRRTFIDAKLIRSLVIHDAFFRYQPIFFLSSSIENQSQRVVFFAETLPRLAVLQVVLRGLRHVLYGEEEEGPSLSEIQSMQSSSQQQPVASDEDTYTRSDDSGVEASRGFPPSPVDVSDGSESGY